jgi:LPS-assembly lipoprotein
MSLPERKWKFVSRLLGSTLLSGLVLASACTVRPLYAPATSTAAGATTTAQLSSISVKPVATRYGQEVRNHLIFLFNGGQGEPASPAYVLDPGVTALNEPAAIIQIGNEDEPTAGTITMTSRYTLTQSGKPVAKGTRQVSASYDAPRQEFARLRAVRDAENRAARELAELVRLAVAQDLERGASR